MSVSLSKFQVWGGWRRGCGRVLRRRAGVVWGQKAFSERLLWETCSDCRTRHRRLAAGSGCVPWAGAAPGSAPDLGN